MRFTTLFFAGLAAFYASAMPVEPKRNAAAAPKSEAGPAPGFKPIIVWEHTNGDDDDGMAYQWRRRNE
ncbi:hypothetical protein DDE82_008828 [Stemphylium lycopersici]|nr:hypothetical protein DDE82_008828 [Stemphylium lycopersici]